MPRLPASRLLAGTLLLLSGCARAPLLGPPAAPPDSARVRALLASGGETRSLRGTYEVEMTRPGERVVFDAILAIRGPADLRIEVLGVIGGPRVLATVDGGRFAAYDADRHEYLTGTANAANLEAALGAPLDPEVFARVLLGRAAAIDPNEEPEAAADGPFERVTVRDAAGRSLRLWAEPDAAHARRLSLADAEGAETFAAEFEGWTEPRAAGAPSLPSRLSLSFPTSGTRLTLALDEAEANPVLPDRLFRLRRPPGARQRDLDAEPPG